MAAVFFLAAVDFFGAAFFGDVLDLVAFLAAVFLGADFFVAVFLVDFLAGAFGKLLEKS